MLRGLTLLATLSLAAAAPSQYDYIVIGGGTSGLAVANRLSENNPQENVLIIEAGDSVLDNPNVTAVDGYGLAFGTQVDWQYESVNQTYGGHTRQVLRAGKALAGTSAINGMAYTRAEDVQIDAWQAIGNEGWTWRNLLPYYLKSENLTQPTTMQVSAGAAPNPAWNGKDGPLKLAYSVTSPSQLTALLNQTHQNLGVPWTEDINGGKMRGFSIYPSTIDAEGQVREDAARAYYWPYQSRENLHVLVNTFANRIVWREGLGKNKNKGDITASGVEITSHNGTVRVISAKKEVIISAGSLKSPALLELSGIGNPDILKKYNIPVRVNLPTVGENLQDQMNSGMAATSRTNITDGSAVVVYPNAYDIFGNETTAVANSLRANLKQYAVDTAKVSRGSMKTVDLERLFEIQHDLIFKDRTPIAEIIYTPGGAATLSSQFWGLLPFARGNVHIGSSNPLQKPTINPNYFMLDWDLQSHVAINRFIRRTFETAPLRDLVAEESTPGFSVVPRDASVEDWKEWMFDGHYRSNFHPVGTAAMMPRSLGGVVNGHLIVYGTTNVRVVDASVLPFQVCGHLVSTLYAVAERAADLIKDESV
ncbi:hypothetical protein EYZ11_010384 [Aspergillus tanneri]|uniref:glucose oxidase n=1 Tax=Aspergillus tanneri TaxID=1220188 RepID=A0A4S3J7M9_9EURO|nr:uncharacterized protein ATNIH1004_006588 [Aspergillus tanneri]KAA8647886.1 hypothetical protein ATNIH1004_006588 [Aspergillus tanneri]THC90157.1 hypothetical protein EYZ11_010384 [Aspergillus tanneri]